jgi:hypothetical protein
MSVTVSDEADAESSELSFFGSAEDLARVRLARPAFVPDSELDTVEQPAVCAAVAAADWAARDQAARDQAAEDQAAAGRAAIDQVAAKQAAAEVTMALLLSLAVTVPDRPVPDTPVPVQPVPVQPVPVQKAPPDRGVPRHAARPARRKPVPRVHAWAGLGTARGWPVGVILAVQAAGSLRLIWSSPAAGAEAGYLVAGGAGGLVAARLESLALMLAATLLLHGVTRRLFDRRSAFFAAALFAGLAGATFLGAVAGPSALALAALALAAWLGIRAAGAGGWSQLALAAAGGVALVAANVAAYAAGPGDLVVLAVTALAVWRGRNGAAAARAVGASIVGASIAAAGLAAGLAGTVGFLAGGPAAWPDQVRLLLSRAVLASPGLAWSAGGPPLTAAQATVRGAGVLAVLAAAGALAAISARQGWPLGAVTVILAAAVAMAPGDYGAWFACAGGGYAVASLARAVPRAKASAAFAAGLGLVILAAVPAVPLAARPFDWPGASPVAAQSPAVPGHVRGRQP